MLDAIYIATSGMKAEQAQIDNISNNLANLNTNAYKKSSVSFEDLMYREVTSATSALSARKGNVSSGLGTAITSINKDFKTGDLKPTQNPLDIAIKGDGFLEVVLDNGEYAYTRNGALKVSEDGLLSIVTGEKLAGGIRIPSDAQSLKITQQGKVVVAVDNNEVEVGEIELASFVSNSELQSVGGGLYMETEGSGRALYSLPGENGVGELQQGFVEASNVDLVEEMMSLMVAQRAYEVGSQIIRASDEILKINNNLRS